MYDELTQVDIDKMKAELEHRRLELRPKLIEDVQTARAFGDLSENYEYKVAKQEKNRNESRIRYLERMIATAKVIEVNEKEGTVGLFDHVALYNEKLGKEQNIQLVTTLRQNALKFKSAMHLSTSRTNFDNRIRAFFISSSFVETIRAVSMLSHLAFNPSIISFACRNSSSLRLKAAVSSSILRFC